MDLIPTEIRVLGCLLEKQRTTPDHYPLSLNSLRLACNQATNREPVVDYDDATVRDALHRLERRGYTRLAGASRAAKYRHLLSEALPMSSGEQAVMCVLMLRGPQTPGELKQRGERIHAFEGLDEVHSTLAGLIERDLVAQLQRRPGQKEERYAQLLGDSESSNDGTAAVNGAPATWTAPPPQARQPDDLRDRVELLEREVAELRAALAELAGEDVAAAPGSHGDEAHGELSREGGPPESSPSENRAPENGPLENGPSEDGPPENGPSESIPGIEPAWQGGTARAAQ